MEPCRSSFSVCPQKDGEGLSESRLVPRRALPNDHCLPAQVIQIGEIARVACSIAFYFLIPERNVGFRQPTEFAAVPVPIATVDQDNLAEAGEYQVGRAG